jgi:hypothetical protein
MPLPVCTRLFIKSIINGDDHAMEITMNLTLEEILKKIEAGYDEIVRLYRSVPVTAVLEDNLSNGWSVKDLLAHVAAWEWRCASLLEASHNTKALLKAQPDVDALNREIHEERKDWGWEEVEYDFRAAHRTLLAAIQQLPPKQLNDEFVQQTIAEETWEHYAEHLDELRRWRRRINR